MAALVILYRIIQKPHGARAYPLLEFSTPDLPFSVSTEYGVYVALVVAAIVTVAGAVLAAREQSR